MTERQRATSRLASIAAATAPAPAPAASDSAGLQASPTPSFWLENAGTDPTAAAPPPPVPPEADFVVVGGGMTGVSTAYWLNKLGHSCVLLEGRGLAGGASGRNGGVLSGGSEFHMANIEMLKGIMAEQGGFDEFEYRLGGYLRIAFEGSDEAKEYRAMELGPSQQLWVGACPSFPAHRLALFLPGRRGLRGVWGTPGR